MKKIDKKFVLSDSSLNTYGFRLLTAGYQLSEFAKNPIGYYMHQRDNGIIVRWENLKVEGDKITGTPIINDSNARGQQTIDEIEAGFLNAASVGHIVVLETSEDPALMLSGQTGPTVTKWFNRECSLVDIPANKTALCPLYDRMGQLINLKQLSATDAKVSPVNDINSLESKFPPVRSLLASALADKDITEEIAKELLSQYEHQPSKLIPLLKDFAQMRIKHLMGMDWNEFDRGGFGEELVQKYFTGYNLKRYLQFGKKSNGQIDNDAFLEFAIDNGYILEKEIIIDFFIETEKNTKEVIFDRIYKLILDDTKGLIEADFDSLSEDSLKRLKQEAFASYKQNYLDHFGIKYTEPYQMPKKGNK